MTKATCRIVNQTLHYDYFTKRERRCYLKTGAQSPLNTDYKILATVLATRLKPLLPKVINEDQTCGIPGRSIFQNLFRLRDIAYDASINGGDVIMINLDQEKAFDKVDRSFLFKTMSQMNFGDSFIHWVTTLYQNANSNILNNGWSSDPVLHRGVRQGCPLSLLLSVIIAEKLAIRDPTRPENHKCVSPRVIHT